MQFDRIGISEGIDINKTGKLKECIICHYWYIKEIGHRFEPHICNGYGNILMIVYGLKNIAILYVKDVDYRCVLWNMTRNDVINMLDNSKLDDKCIL